MKDLYGKTAIVTGAASGIGKAIAELLASYGVNTVVSDLNTKQGEEVVKAIEQASGKASFLRADVSQPADCEKLVQFAKQQYGKLDIAVNNALLALHSSIHHCWITWMQLQKKHL